MTLVSRIVGLTYKRVMKSAEVLTTPNLTTVKNYQCDKTAKLHPRTAFSGPGAGVGVGVDTTLFFKWKPYVLFLKTKNVSPPV